MGVTSRRASFRAGVPLAIAALLVAGVFPAAGALLDARTAGMSYWATTLLMIVAFPVTILAAAGSGWLISRRGDPVVARWTLATAASLLVYFAGIAAMTWLVLHRDPGAELVGWVALPGLGGYLLPLALLQAALLTARDRVAGSPGKGRAGVALVLGIAGVSLLIGAGAMAPDPPLDGISAPLADTWVAALGTRWVQTPVWIAWMLSMLVSPLALWQTVGRSAGLVRRRLSLLAVVALLPPLTVGCCVLLLPALMAADLPQSVAGDVLFAFFCLTFALTPAGLAFALDNGSKGWSNGLSFQISLRVIVGLLFGLAAVTISTLVALAFARGSLSVAVVVTVGIVTLLWPLNSRVARRLALRVDPRLSVASALLKRPNEPETAQPARAVRQVLRTALDDPDLEVVVRLPDTQRWVSVDGEDLPRPQDQPAEHITPILDREGECCGYVQHMTTAADAGPIVAEVSPLLDQAILEIAVRHQSEQLAAERARANRAAAEERQRLERDLHDGVQGRLLALAINLQAADASTRDGETQLVLSDAVSSLRTAIEEVRRLGSGSAPETLSRDGLRPALAELARRLPVPVSLRVPSDRLDPAQEVIAYLVVSEALTNTVKHAGSCSVDVAVRVDGEMLTIQVADDGAGGADVRAGTGLRGLSERVNAAGGTLVVSDRPAGGTVLEVALPCGP